MTELSSKRTRMGEEASGRVPSMWAKGTMEPIQMTRLKLMKVTKKMRRKTVP